MRLIDADELTRVIIARSFYYSIETNILNIIDNAPTVKPCDNCDLYFIAKTKAEMRKGINNEDHD